jgi:hypothetical protein
MILPWRLESGLEMHLHRWLLVGAVAFAAFAPIQQAQAVSVQGTASFSDIGPGGNNLYFTGVINPGVFSTGFNLSYGSPVTLADFLTITAVDTNYNFLSTATDTIKTTFSITQPSLGNGSVTGTGTDVSLLFVFDGGNIHWNGPAIVDLGGGLDLSIALSDGSFFGILGGPLPSVAINATFSLTGNTVSQAPLPAALPLFATGLGAMGLLGWWRRKRQGLFASATA